MQNSSNDERLDYLFLNLIGSVVKVHLIDGSVLEGVFVSRSDKDADDTENSDADGIFLTHTSYVSSSLHDDLSPSQFNKLTVCVRYVDILFVEATDARVRYEAPGTQTNAYRGEHALKTMDWTTGGPLESLEDGKTESWDQFKANEKFGVKTTYDENKYTTKLDLATVSEAEQAFADRKAKEIEESATRGIQHEVERNAHVDADEGELYSDVHRGNSKNAGGRGAAAKGNKRPDADGNFNPDPAATPFTPTRYIENYLKHLADAIEKDPSCYSSSPDWPGDSPPMAENPYYAAKPNFPPNRPPPVHQHHNAPPPQHRPPGNNMNYSGGYPPQGPASFDSYPPPPQARPLPTRGKFQPPQPQQPMVSQVDSSDKLQADKKKIRRGGIGKDDSKKGPGK